MINKLNLLVLVFCTFSFVPSAFSFFETCDKKMQEAARSSWAQVLHVDPNTVDVSPFVAMSTRMGSDNEVGADIRLSYKSQTAVYSIFARQIDASDDCKVERITKIPLDQRVGDLENRVTRLESSIAKDSWSCQAYCGGYVSDGQDRSRLESMVVTSVGTNAAQAFSKLKCKDHLFTNVVQKELVFANISSACVKN